MGHAKPKILFFIGADCHLSERPCLVGGQGGSWRGAPGMRKVLVLAWHEHCMWVSWQIRPALENLQSPAVPGGGQQVEPAPA